MSGQRVSLRVAMRSSVGDPGQAAVGSVGDAVDPGAGPEESIVSSSRFRVDAHEHELQAGDTPKWSVVVTDTVTSEEIASYPPSFATEGEAREQAEFEIRNFERRRSGEWDSR